MASRAVSWNACRVPDQGDKVPFRVRIATPRGATTMEFGVSPTPMRLANLVPLAQALASAQVERTLQCEADEGRQLSCKAGCGACCRQLVPISPPEAFALASMTVALDAAARDELIQRVERAVAEIDRRGALPQLRELIQLHAERDLQVVARDYFALGIPCPFLIDESCGIHAHRPAACREYNVTSPAEWCSAPQRHKLAFVPVALAMSPPLSRLTARLTGRKPELVPLPLAFEYAEANLELAFRTWPGPELVGRFIEELGAEAALDEPHRRKRKGASRTSAKKARKRGRR